MNDTWLVERFEEHRPRLRALAYRMLGSLAEADDAVQDVWLRVSRADPDDVENLGGWLTTITGRVCLNQLRSRGNRREDPMDGSIPDPIVTVLDDPRPGSPGAGPEDEAVLADSVSLALLVVLETLGPAERLAFVLHDMFGLAFEEIAPLVERTPAAARQLASRARRRVRGAELPTADPDLDRQRSIVDAFFLAARSGELDALVAVLDPDIVLRADFGRRPPTGAEVRRGAEVVASQAIMFANPAAVLRPALVNGGAGVVVEVDGQPFAVMSFTVVDGRIVEIDVLSDPDRVPAIVAAGLG